MCAMNVEIVMPNLAVLRAAVFTLSGKSQGGGGGYPPHPPVGARVKAYVHRALTHHSTWELVHQEIRRIKEILADNNYPIAAVEREIKLALAEKLEHQSPKEPTVGTTYNLSTGTRYLRAAVLTRGPFVRSCTETARLF